MTTNNAAINEPASYKPVDPANFGRFPTPERERLDKLGKQAMTAKGQTESDPLAVGVKALCEKLGYNRTRACDLVGSIDQSKFLGWLNGFRTLDDAEQQQVRRWLTKHGWAGVGDPEPPKADFRAPALIKARAASQEKALQRLVEQAALAAAARGKIAASGRKWTSVAVEIGVSNSSFRKFLDGTGGFFDKGVAAVTAWLADEPIPAKPFKLPPTFGRMQAPLDAPPVRLPEMPYVPPPVEVIPEPEIRSRSRVDAADRLSMLMGITRDEALNRILATVDPKAIAIGWHQAQILALEQA